MTQINWQYQVNNRSGGYVVTAGDWNDFAGNFRAFIDQTTGSGTTDNSPLPIGIDLVNDRVYISDPDSATPEDANHANTTLSVVGSSTFNGTVDMTAGVLQGGSPLVFEGATDNAYETTFAITDPTADRTITFKDGTGTVAFTSDITTTSPAGSDHQVQFNDNGSFGADSNFTYDGSAATLKANLTVGVDDTGHDVLFYGATAGSYWFWDEALNQMEVSQQFTSSTLTDFTQSLDNATIHIVGDYEAGHYQGAILWSTDDDSSTKPKAGIFTHYDGGGATMYFGTSASYGTGINGNALMSLDDDGKVQIHAQANALSIVDTAANQSGYIGFYDSGPTRLGYVGYPANDDLYIKQEDGDGDLYIISENARIYLQAETYFFWSIAGNYEMRLDNARLRPYTDLGLSLGDASARWNVLYVNEIEADDGSVSDPSYTFNGDEDTGIYATTNVLRFATGGNQRGLFSSSGLYAIKASGYGTTAVWSSSTGYLLAYASSIRFKENVVDMPKSTWEKVYQLQPRSFDWKDDGSVEIPVHGKADYGFIAEEVNSILPDVVTWSRESNKDDDDEIGLGNESELQIQAVSYEKLTTYLVAAIQDLKARIETLEG